MASKNTRKPRRKSRKASRKPPEPEWARWKTEQLLDLRLSRLDLQIKGTVLEGRIHRLHEELDRRSLRVTPYFWISDDWFTPDGYTGTAIPFYLLHPRLTRLERSQVGEVEGGTQAWCMKFLRHEAGHVVDHAFRLHKRRRWQQLFGRSSYHYPRFYRPNPYSRRHVQHLEYWYAQSHPDEDFAETFAVWLQPRSGWRKRYQGWPALKKLQYVDELMKEIAGTKPAVRTKNRVEPLSTLRKTLREHYARRLSGYETEYPNIYDNDLKKLFPRKRRKGGQYASALLRRLQPEIVRTVTPWLGGDRYLVGHVIRELIGRARELELGARGTEGRVKKEFSILLTKHVMNSLFRNRRWVEM
ncbi:MAG: putative zinc-binding metallopeptidase [Planctomycetota bacterium]|jgi:hypothetical protein